MIRRTGSSKDNRSPAKRLTVVSYGKYDAKIISSDDEEASPTNRRTSGSKVVFKGKFAQQRLDALAKQGREKERALKSPGSGKQRKEEQESSSVSSSATDALKDVSSSSDDEFIAPSPKKRPAGLPVRPPKKRPARSRI